MLPDGDAGDLIDRDFDCRKMSWVAYWFNLCIQSNLITIKHVLVQVIVYVIYLLLMPRFRNWSSLPALRTFASVLHYISKGKVYCFTRGKAFFGKGSADQTRVQIVRLEYDSDADHATLYLVHKKWLQRALPVGTTLSIFPSPSDEVDWDGVQFESLGDLLESEGDAGELDKG